MDTTIRQNRNKLAGLLAVFIVIMTVASVVFGMVSELQAVSRARAVPVTGAVSYAEELFSKSSKE